jgi:hypothetical protein
VVATLRRDVSSSRQCVMTALKSDSCFSNGAQHHGDQYNRVDLLHGRLASYQNEKVRSEIREAQTFGSLAFLSMPSSHGVGPTQDVFFPFMARQPLAKSISTSAQSGTSYGAVCEIHGKSRWMSLS